MRCMGVAMEGAFGYRNMPFRGGSFRLQASVGCGSRTPKAQKESVVWLFGCLGQVLKTENNVMDVGVL